MKLREKVAEGGTGALSETDNLLYHKFEIRNMLMSGEKLPGIIEQNRERLMEYTANLINHGVK